METYPKRLIEVDLPIKRISDNCRRERNVRSGHIANLHIWWARRPLAACRAVICASLWPDPADELCPENFRKIAREQMSIWAKHHLGLLSGKSMARFVAISKNENRLDDLRELRGALLEFIADYSDWGNSNVIEYLETSRLLTSVAHNAMGGETGTRPLVVDCFAGGGAIPIEALRVGANAFGVDSNPVAVLLNKIVLEYIPKYGNKLSDEVQKWGEWITNKAKEDLSILYPNDPDGYQPLAYLWARTIRCEGPGCGVELPLLNNLWLARKRKGSVAVRIIANSAKKTIEFEILENAKASDVKEGTVKRGSATCVCCGFTTPVSHVRQQLSERRGGTVGARLYVVVLSHPERKGRKYRLPNETDFIAIEKANHLFLKRKSLQNSAFPEECLPATASGYCAPPTYGAKTFSDLFNQRQLLIARWFIDSFEQWWTNEKIADFKNAVQSCIALVVDRMIDSNSSQCWWVTIHGETVMRTFGRQAYPIVWNYAEINPFSDSSRGFRTAIKNIVESLDHIAEALRVEPGTINLCDARNLPLPDDSCEAVVTDPPYYNAIPYSDLADFYQVWLQRFFRQTNYIGLNDQVSPKTSEIVEMAGWDSTRYSYKTKDWYEKSMMEALERARIALKPNGIMVIVFAHKKTSAWEALLNAVVGAGWVIIGSWPIDTENARRLRAQQSAALDSSIHLVCRPRENSDGSLCTDDIGDWRDVLAELPKRIHEWMPNLGKEDVVGADAIFACLGPALEIYSRFSSVEKASGEKVQLKEYLEEVWAAVSREALNMIFEGADASGFEEDARLTAMWLWTLRTAVNGNDNEDEVDSQTKSLPGYTLEYDAARKIAQGLGAHLEKLSNLVEIKGDSAMLLSAGARARYLFGKDAGAGPKGSKKKSAQQKFEFMLEVKDLESESGDWAGTLSGRPGSTVLDQLHQSMILFGAGRGEAMKRFLVEEGVGRNPLFWRLAQALSALYPAGTDEKRWVDGVLARKKGLGF